MGYQRLMSWGFEPAEIPLGSTYMKALRAEIRFTGWGCSTFLRLRTSATSRFVRNSFTTTATP